MADYSIDLDSNFQRRMIEIDFTKTLFDILNDNLSDFLLIDLIDERFPVLQLNESFITASNEAVSGIENLSNYKRLHKKIEDGHLILECKKTRCKNRQSCLTKISSKLNNSLILRRFTKTESINIDECISAFCHKILSIYDGNHVILHRALMVDYYFDKNGSIKSFDQNQKKYNQEINTILIYMYDFIENNIPEVHVINAMDNAYADESHKWGLAPMHYNDDYYKEVLNQLTEITKSVIS